MSGPAGVVATQVAGGPSSEARAFQAPSRHSQSCEPSTMTQIVEPSSASAVTARPASASTDLDASPSSSQSPPPVPTKILWLMLRGYSSEESSRASEASSLSIFADQIDAAGTVRTLARPDRRGPGRDLGAARLRALGEKAPRLLLYR